MEPAEAVRAYHGDLQKLGIKPYRSLEDDLVQTATASSYAGQGDTTSRPEKGSPGGVRVTMSTWRAPPDDPEFERMSPKEKALYNIERWKRILG
jgi:hypothetical protein